VDAHDARPCGSGDALAQLAHAYVNIAPVNHGKSVLFRLPSASTAGFITLRKSCTPLKPGPLPINNNVANGIGSIFPNINFTAGALAPKSKAASKACTVGRK